MAASDKGSKLELPAVEIRFSALARSSTFLGEDPCIILSEYIYVVFGRY